jgi:pimeloyl-ACP methyl ester carboxylesterase
VDVDGVGIEYDVTGDGPPVVLLHGFPDSGRLWRHQVPALAEDDWSNFRTWAGHPDADQVIAELEAAGSLTPGLNWYRANVPPESWVGPPLQLPPVQAPTMGV